MYVHKIIKVEFMNWIEIGVMEEVGGARGQAKM